MPVLIFDAFEIRTAMLRLTVSHVGVIPLDALDLLSKGYEDVGMDHVHAGVAGSRRARRSSREGCSCGVLPAHSPALRQRRALLDSSCIMCICARGRAA